MANIEVLQLAAMTTNRLPPAYQQLLAARMSRWIPPLMQLLQHYEGIERALEPEENPLNYLAEQLGQISDTQLAERERLFFDVVTTMPLFYYRVAGSSHSWNPGNETFQQFECRVGTLSIWQEWTPHPSRNEVKNWLYANLAESGHARVTA